MERQHVDLRLPADQTRIRDEDAGGIRRVHGNREVGADAFVAEVALGKNLSGRGDDAFPVGAEVAEIVGAGRGIFRG